MTLNTFAADPRTFNLYAAAPGSQIQEFSGASAAQVAAHIETSARLGHTTLFRAFANEGATNERFLTAWIVEGHKITPHTDVTIPARFF